MYSSTYIFQHFFSLSDLISALSWLIILSFLIIYQASKIKIPTDRRVFIINFYFKIILSLAFTTFYLLIFRGGDTIEYWNGALAMNSIFHDSPVRYFDVLFSDNSIQNYHHFFDIKTGFPSTPIYYEQESYFICKTTSFISLFTFRSYLATTFIYAYIFSIVNWRLYKVIRQTNLFQSNYLVYAMLFVPSVSFWCAGVAKDTIILTSFMFIFYGICELVYNRKFTVPIILGTLISLLFIFKTRNFMLIAIFVPLIAGWITYLNRKFNLKSSTRIVVYSFFLTALVFTVVQFLNSQLGLTFIQNNSFIQHAFVVQDDFTNNVLYGKNQYSLGEIDNTPLGILQAMPISIFSGIFQPLPWNGLSVNLIMNALESAVLIILFVRLIVTRKLFLWIRTIQQHEILVFFLVFVLIIAFMAGFTSIIYGVLVRIRAPLLPFVFGLLVVNMDKKTIA